MLGWRQVKEVGGMVEVFQWIDAAAHRQIRQRKAARKKAQQKAVWAPVVWQACMEISMDIFGFAGCQPPPVRGPVMARLFVLRLLWWVVLRWIWVDAWDLVTSGSLARNILDHWFSFYLSIFPSFCQMWPSPRLLLVLVAYVATHEVRVHQRLIISPCLPTVKKSQLTEEAIIYKVVYTIMCSRWQGVCASPLGGRVPYLIQ